jgi:Alpha/beta hydrolase family
VRRPRKRTVGVSILVVLAVLLAVGVAAFAWYVQPQPLLPEAEASLASTPEVTFTSVDGRLEWAPADRSYTTGLVIYPGGKVPAAAYGPLAQEIAAAGYLVVITPMPFNLAVFDIGAAGPAIAAHPEVGRWALGGHSLGGSMACQYTADHPDQVEGLALWASYCATDISATSVSVVSIYGSNDPGAARMSGEEARAALPPDAVFVEIPGGNHEQMAWYTGQPNDGVPAVARELQQHAVAQATITMLEGLSSP